MRSLKTGAFPAFALFVLLAASCNDPNLRSPEEQLAIDVQQIDDYLAATSVTAYKDISGIRFNIVSLGTGGFPPSYEQQVTVKYKGKLLDGTVFEESSTTNFVRAYIPGWQRALPLLPKGTKATIYIPSGLAYGADAQGKIPANSILVFDVEMQNVILSASDKLRTSSDLQAIDKYLTDHSITAVADTTGVRYQITAGGTGAKPTWYSKVKFKYTGKLLNGDQFATGTAEPSSATDSRVVDYINGVKFGLSKLGVGGKGTFYIPSVLAFGANASGTAPVPANANVIYEIELLEIVP